MTVDDDPWYTRWAGYMRLNYYSSLYIIPQTNFLSLSYSANCHPYTMGALWVVKRWVRERSLVLFFIYKLAERTSLNSFGQISAAHLVYSSWNRLTISTERGGTMAELRYSGHLIIRFGEIFQLCPVRTPAFSLVWLYLTSTLWVNFLSPISCLLVQ